MTGQSLVEARRSHPFLVDAADLTLEEARALGLEFWIEQVCTQPGDHQHAVAPKRALRN